MKRPEWQKLLRPEFAFPESKKLFPPMPVRGPVGRPVVRPVGGPDSELDGRPGDRPVGGPDGGPAAEVE